MFMCLGLSSWFVGAEEDFAAANVSPEGFERAG